MLNSVAAKIVSYQSTFRADIPSIFSGTTDLRSHELAQVSRCQKGLRFIRAMCGSAVLLASLAFSQTTHAQSTAAQVCAAPGRDGPSTASGLLNTYYPGVGSATGNSITLGAQTPASGVPAIAAGDLVLVIQMQGAAFNSSDTNRYGDGLGNGSNTDNTGDPARGYTGTPKAGNFEYARVSAVNGSTITLANALTHSYSTNTSSSWKTDGRETFQVVRVPQFSSWKPSGTSYARPWDPVSGTGGILVVDVAGQIDLNGQTLNASGRGFAGGGTYKGNEVITNPNFVYRTHSDDPDERKKIGGTKGEGISGTPMFVNALQSLSSTAIGSESFQNFTNTNNTAATTENNTYVGGIQGYPGGDFARGAPGNAGGGGNQHNSGGGGGGNGGIGGYGGKEYRGFQIATVFPYTSGLGQDIGGHGGGSFIDASSAKLVMGGGGGAGDFNNSDFPDGSGGAGGGLILVRAGAIVGAGSLLANGADGRQSTAQKDGVGGGGAGGSIYINSNTSTATIIASAVGGRGADSNVTLGNNDEREGPGGGGGGGVLVSNVSLTTISLAGGSNGRSNSSDVTDGLPDYGSTPGALGVSLTLAVAPAPITGTGQGSACFPALTVKKSTSPSALAAISSLPADIKYTFTVINTGPGWAQNVVINDTQLVSGMGIASAGTVDASNNMPNTAGESVVLSGGSALPLTLTKPAAGSQSFTLQALDIPPGGTVDITVPVTLSATMTSGVYHNGALLTYNDPTRDVGSALISPATNKTEATANGGTAPVSNTVYATGASAGSTIAGSNYSGQAAGPNAEDVIINLTKLDVIKNVAAPIQVAPLVAGQVRFEVPYTVTVKNTGALDAINVQLIENFNAAYGAGNVVGIKTPLTSTTATFISGSTASTSTPALTGACTANAAFTGLTGAITLLTGDKPLLPNDSCTISFVAIINYPNLGAVPTSASDNRVFAVSTAAPMATPPTVSGSGATASLVMPVGINALTTDISAGNSVASGGTPTPPVALPSTPNGDNTNPPPTGATLIPQQIGIAKAVAAPGASIAASKKLVIPFSIVVSNTGTIPATNVQVDDDIATQLGVAASTVVITGLNTGACTSNGAAFTGTSTGKYLLAGTDTLAPASSCTITFTATIDYSVSSIPSTALQNVANASTYASAPGAGGVPTGLPLASDASTNGATPTAGNPANPATDPSNNVPTPIAVAQLGLAKAIVAPTAVTCAAPKVIAGSTCFEPSTGKYTIAYEVLAQNMGNESLSSVQLTDDLAATFSPIAAADITVSAAPVVSAIVAGTANPAAASTNVLAGSGNASYTGKGANNLLSSAVTLAAGGSFKVNFSVDVKPAIGQNGPFNNTAKGTGTGAVSNKAVTDDSQDGASPDSNNDGLPTDNNAPTPVTLASPILDVVKNVGVPVQVATASPKIRFEIPYTITVKNNGTKEATNTQTVDDLDATYGAANVVGIKTALTAASASVAAAGAPASTTCSANTAFTGKAGNIGLLAGTDTLTVGGSCTVSFIAVVEYANLTLVPTAANNNRAIALASVNPIAPTALATTGSGANGANTTALVAPAPAAGVLTTDVSNGNSAVMYGGAGGATTPTTDAAMPATANGDNAASSPTAVTLKPAAIGVAKAAGVPTINAAAGTVSIPYTYTLINYGGTAVNTAKLTDNLATAFAPIPAADIAVNSITIAPAVDAGLQATTCAGTVFAAGTAPLAAGVLTLGGAGTDVLGADCKVVLTLNVVITPKSVTGPTPATASGAFENTAKLDAFAGASAAAGQLPLSDTSQAGNDPAGGSLAASSPITTGGATVGQPGSSAAPGTANPNTGATAGDPAGFGQNTRMVFPGLSVAKAMTAASLTPAADGSYTLPYSVVISNSGAENLTSVSLIDSLCDVASGACTTGAFTGLDASNITIASAPVVAQTAAGTSFPAGASNVMSANASYSGKTAANSNLLGAGQVLLKGASYTVNFSVKVYPCASAVTNMSTCSVANSKEGPFSNTATGAGTGAASGAAVSDASQNGTNPIADPSKPVGAPENNTPTPVSLPTQRVDVIKNVGTPKQVAPSAAGKVRFEVPYTFVVKNTSTPPATHVQLVDKLTAAFPATAAVSIKPTSFAITSSGTACAAPSAAFDGNANIALLGGTSNLLAGETCTIALVAWVEYATQTAAVAATAPSINVAFASTAATANPGASITASGSGASVTYTPTYPAGTIARDVSSGNSAVMGGGTGGATNYSTATGGNAGVIASNTTGAAQTLPTTANGDNAAPPATSVTLAPQQIAVTKAVTGNAVVSATRVLTVPFVVIVKNDGAVPATFVQATDDLAAAFPGASFAATTAVNSATTPSGSTNCATNPAFNGTSDTKLLLGSDTLLPGQACELSFNAVATYATALPTAAQANTAKASTSDTLNGPPLITDDSTDATPPAGGPAPLPPSSIDTPKPTPIYYSQIGVTKRVIPATSCTPPATLQGSLCYTLATNTYTIAYEVVADNMGNETLTNVQLVDNLSATFTGVDAANITSSPVTVTVLAGTAQPAALALVTVSANAGYTGKGNNTLLSTGGSLGVGGKITATFTVSLKPVNAAGVPVVGTFNNTAVGSGTGAVSNAPATDDSNDNTANPAQGPDANGNGTPTDDNKATPVILGLPSVGIAKAVSGAVTVCSAAGVPSADCTAAAQIVVPYKLTIANYGGEAVTQVKVTDNLATTFAPVAASDIAVVPGSVVKSAFTNRAGGVCDTTTGTALVNPPVGSASAIALVAAYNGTSNVDLVAGSAADIVRAGCQVTIDFKVRLKPGAAVPAAASGQFENTAIVSGTGAVSGTSTTDSSQSGNNPDANNNGNPGDDSAPTPVTFPRIALAKQLVSRAGPNANGSYDLTYEVLVKNTGLESVSGITVKDNLANTFATLNAANYTLTPAASKPTVSAVSATVAANAVPASAVTTASASSGNAAYTGQGANIDLLTSPVTLEKSASFKITYVVNVLPCAIAVSNMSACGAFNERAGPFNNVAIGAGTGANTSGPVADTSQNGTNPDPDGDGDPTNNDQPTPVELPVLKIALAKNLVGVAPFPISGPTTGMTFTYQYKVRNDGVPSLPNVQIVDDLSTVFPAPAVIGSPAVSIVSQACPSPAAAPTLAPAAAYTGTGSGTGLLSGSQSLAAGCEAVVQLTVTVSKLAVVSGVAGNTVVSKSYDNTAKASSSATVGGAPFASDDSQDSNALNPVGTDNTTSTGNATGAATDAANAVKTPVLIPQLGVSKQASAPVQVGPNLFDVVYTLRAKNTGSTVLSNVQLRDDLTLAFPAPANATLVRTTSVPAAVADPAATVSSAPANCAGLPVPTGFAQSANGAQPSSVLNANFTGSNANPNIFIANAVNLCPGDEVVATAVVRITNPVMGTAYNNTAQGSATATTDPSNPNNPASQPTISDASTNGATPTAGNPAAAPTDPANNVPTVVSFVGQQVGVAKAATAITQIGLSTFDISYKLHIKNTGSVPASNVQLLDNLAATFPNAISRSITVAPTKVAGTAACVVNTAVYNGVTNNALLDGLVDFAVGETCDIAFTTRVVFAAGTVPSSPQNNSAVGSTKLDSAVPNNGVSTPVSPTIAIDSSQDNTPAGGAPINPAAPLDPVMNPVSGGGTDPTAPVNNAATPVTLQPAKLDVIKAAGVPRQTGPASYEVGYTLVLKNTGPIVVNNVQVIENLNRTFNPTGAATITVALAGNSSAAALAGTTPTTPAANCVANPAYNGTSDQALLSGTASLLPGQACSMSYVVAVNWGTAAAVPAQSLNTVLASSNSQAQTPGGNNLVTLPNNPATAPSYPATATSTDVSSNVAPAVPDGTTPIPGAAPSAASLPAVDPVAAALPTPVSFVPAKIDVVKALSGTPVVVDGQTFDVPYVLTVKNAGSVAAYNVQVSEYLRATFYQTSAGGALPSLTNGGNGAPVIAVTKTAQTGAACTVASAFNGNGNNGLLSGGDTFLAGDSCTVAFTVRVAYASPAHVPSGSAQNNTAHASTTASGAGANPGYSYPAVVANTAPLAPTAPANAVATDASSNGLTPPANGSPNSDTPSATPVTLSSGPDVVVKKTHSPATFTAGNIGTYTITAGNRGFLPTTGTYTVVDTLPTGMTVHAIPTGTGWNCAATVLGSNTATCTSTTVIAANAGALVDNPNTITLQVKVAANACTTANANAQSQCAPLTNNVKIAGGGEVNIPFYTGNNSFDDPTPIQVAASLSGTVWQDLNHNRRLDAGEVPVGGFLVEVIDNEPTSPTFGQVVGSASTAPATQAGSVGNPSGPGGYQVGGLVPGYKYSVRFRDPTTNGVIYGTPTYDHATPNSNGATNVGQTLPASNTVNPNGSNGTSTIANNTTLSVTLQPGQNLFNQSLPLDPAGVVYDSVTRLPVAGASVTILFNGSPADPATIVGNTNTVSSAALNSPLPGAYQFLLLPTAPAGVYTLQVSHPNYVEYALGSPTAGTRPTSIIIPFSTVTPTGVMGSTSSTGVFTPPMGTGVVSANAQNYDGNPPPNGNIDTNYYLQFSLSPLGGMGVVNNHIPLDPRTLPKLVISKTGDRSSAEVGDSVRYTLKVKRVDTGTYTVPASQIVDTLPAGFRYIDGTAQINGVSIADPSGKPAPVLRFTTGPIAAGGEITLTYRVRLAVGSQQGTGINRATATAGLNVNCSLPGALCSNEAQYRVKVTGGVFSNQACVIGKVYVDCNNNHVQDAEELGIPGVRMYLQDGTSITTDVEGKYSYCGLDPRTHVLVLDPTTMPRGSVVTTSSSRNTGDAMSLFLDPKNGELHRADFIEGSCSNPVLEQVKARRTRGEVSDIIPKKAPQKPEGKVIEFDSKPINLLNQSTDSAKQSAQPTGQGYQTPAQTPAPALAPTRSPVNAK